MLIIKVVILKHLSNKDAVREIIISYCYKYLLIFTRTAMSLVETAKANGLEPKNYLRYIFEKLPLTQIEQGYKNLIPQFVYKKDLTFFVP